MKVSRRLNCAPFRGVWDERSCARSATAIHSVAVDRTCSLPVETQTLYRL